MPLCNANLRGKLGLICHWVLTQDPERRICSGAHVAQVRLEMDTATGRRIRGHKARGLAANGPNESMFMNTAEGREMSVAEYYEKTYGIRCGGA